MPTYACMCVSMYVYSWDGGGGGDKPFTGPFPILLAVHSFIKNLTDALVCYTKPGLYPSLIQFKDDKSVSYHYMIID